MLANNFFRDHGLVYQVEKIYLYHVDLREPSMKELRGMYNNTNFNDTELRNIIEGQIGSFELLFRKYYQVLCHYCMGILDDAKKTEDVVQDTFVYLWENKDFLEVLFVPVCTTWSFKSDSLSGIRTTTSPLFDGVYKVLGKVRILGG